MSGFEEFVFFCGPCVRMGGVALCRSGLEEPLVFFADFGSAWAVLRLQERLGRAAFFFLRTLGPHGRCCACRSGLEEPLLFFLRTLGPHGRCCACRSGLEEPLFFFADFGSAWAVLRLQKRLGRAAFFLYADLASAWLLVVAAMLKRCFRPLERPS